MHKKERILKSAKERDENMHIYSRPIRITFEFSMWNLKVRKD